MWNHVAGLTNDMIAVIKMKTIFELRSIIKRGPWKPCTYTSFVQIMLIFLNSNDVYVYVFGWFQISPFYFYTYLLQVLAGGTWHGVFAGLQHRLQQVAPRVPGEVLTLPALVSNIPVCGGGVWGWCSQRAHSSSTWI